MLVLRNWTISLEINRKQTKSANGKKVSLCFSGLTCHFPDRGEGLFPKGTSLLLFPGDQVPTVSREESLLALDMFADVGTHKAMTVRE